MKITIKYFSWVRVKIQKSHELFEFSDKMTFSKLKRELINQNSFFDKENLIYENENEKVYANTINKYNLADFLVIKNWFSYANLIEDKSYMKIFDFKIDTNYLSEAQIKKIISRKKIN